MKLGDKVKAKRAARAAEEPKPESPNASGTGARSAAERAIASATPAEPEGEVFTTPEGHTIRQLSHVQAKEIEAKAGLDSRKETRRDETTTDAQLAKMRVQIEGGDEETDESGGGGQE